MPLAYFTYVQEWSRYKATVKFPFYIPPGRLYDVCLGLVLTSVVYSGVSGGSTSAVMCLLCNTIYLIVSSLISSFGSKLNQKFKNQNLSGFIFNEIKNFKLIVLLTEAVDKALNACAFCLYCELCSMIFITISLAISQEGYFHSGLVKFFIAWNFINQLYMFYNLTIGGSAILEEGEKVKKVGLECPYEVSQKSCLISNEKDKSVMAFFLLLGSIRDNLLKVTGGGIFLIDKMILLTVMNAVVTYSEEGEKLKKVGLECRQEVCQQSCFISKVKDKSVVSFFLLLGSIRDNLWRVTGGEEGEKLKKVGLECPLEVSDQSCLMSKEKDISVMAFFMLLGSIRDNLLTVTGGGMFVIQKTILLTVLNAVVTYSVIMFQLYVEKK
ncbi:uncharacterized protein CDAR_291 [Caerostris darwini]|uniref:Gustatory receptor n=1 Tax=Caerostris darwini TaxID=1538125 RepID=A0AAV4VDK9_9ARAC|nr:uncharacterized protein CDAR_291 [Caerostris darwini]